MLAWKVFPAALALQLPNERQQEAAVRAQLLAAQGVQPGNRWPATPAQAPQMLRAAIVRVFAYARLLSARWMGCSGIDRSTNYTDYTCNRAKRQEKMPKSRGKHEAGRKKSWKGRMFSEACEGRMALG